MHSELITVVALLSVLAAEGRNVPIVKRDAVSFPIPEDCKGDFCFIKFDEARQKIVDEVFNKLNKTMVTQDMDHSMFNQREGLEKPINLCKLEREMRNAYYIKDEQDQWRIVVQSEKRYIQNFKMEFCKKPGLLTSTSSIPDTVYETNIQENKAFLYCDTEYFETFHYLVLTQDLTSTENVKPKNGVPRACNCIFSKTKRE